MDYFDYMMQMNHSKSEGWVAFEKKEAIQSSKKLLAYYLPQFHVIPENDLNWGKGFTEWRNVSKALPLFDGHIQPKHPADLGFYDLSSVDVLRKQAELAKNYGIGGFSFYYYWFDSKVLLDTPIENLYKNPDIDIDYCVFWANENWTRSWDGLEKEVIVQQKHSAEDDIRFIAHISRYFSDPRYIRHNGKPVLLVYRPELFPNARETAERWRSWCVNNGFEAPYLITAQSMGTLQSPVEIDFDAAVEFPPHGSSACNVSDLKTLLDVNRFSQQRDLQIYDYASAVKAWSYRNAFDYKLFKCVFPSWDNSARRVSSRATVFAHSTPALYRQWLMNCLSITDPGEFVFINAWNEWTEGAFLEPDLYWGHAYLSATWEALAASADGERLKSGLV